MRHFFLKKGALNNLLNQNDKAVLYDFFWASVKRLLKPLLLISSLSLALTLIMMTSLVIVVYYQSIREKIIAINVTKID